MRVDMATEEGWRFMATCRKQEKYGRRPHQKKAGANVTRKVATVQGNVELPKPHLLAW